jgi:hypothetical protein
MKIGDLVKRKTPRSAGRPERLGVITDIDDMGFFIMNYYVQWQDNIQDEQLWYRDDELEVISESR